MIKTAIKKALVHTALYHPCVELRYPFAGRGVNAWVRAGNLAPPQHQIKQEIVREEYARRFGAKTLVETGTYFGDMINAMKREFNRIISRARAHFRSCENVEGDSAAVLPLVATLDGPVLFWLDGHFPGGITAKGKTKTPVLDELRAILAQKESGHVILIDDARDFGRASDYPSPDELRAFVVARRPEWGVAVSDDVIRAHRGP